MASTGPAWAQFPATISPPAPLNIDAATDVGGDEVPQIATDGMGHWVAVWHSNDNLFGTIGTDLDILVSRSSDNGATWTFPEALNTDAVNDTGDDKDPHIATDRHGHWVTVWSSNDDLNGTKGTDYDILVARSTDNGATWTFPVALNTNAFDDVGDDFRPRIATDTHGHWVVVWDSTESLLGLIGTDSDILTARSVDNGATWTPPEALNTDAFDDVGDDLSPDIATDEVGHWVAVWYSDDTLNGTIGNDLDILTARSADNGATWTMTVPLNNNAGTDLGDDRFPRVAVTSPGHWVTVWESNDILGGTVGSDSDIFVARSTDDGATWTDPLPLVSQFTTYRRRLHAADRRGRCGSSGHRVGLEWRTRRHGRPGFRHPRFSKRG